MRVNQDEIENLVREEARRLMVPWQAVEPLVSVITAQWYMYGHWDWFTVNMHRASLLDTKLRGNPLPLTTQCLRECLNIIKNNQKRYLKGNSNEDTGGSDDPFEPVSTEVIPASDPGRDREQGV